MGLSKSRILTDVEGGLDHELRGIHRALDALPDRTPFLAWPSVDIYDEARGRLYEIDLIVLGRHALYVVELKDYHGALYGDRQDWRLESEGRATWRPGPLSLTDLKCKVLRSLLGPAAAGIRVEPLILLTNDNLDDRLSPEGRTRVVKLSKFGRAITDGEYPGRATRGRSGDIVDARVERAIKKRLKELGLRRSRGHVSVLGHRLTTPLHQTDDFQDFLAEHEQLDGRVSRARVYSRGADIDPDSRKRAARVARREAERLQGLGHHPNILALQNFDDGNGGDSRLGPTLLYEWHPKAASLHQWLHQNPDASLDTRVALIEQIGEGLQHCHEHDVLHRALDADCIAVFEEDESVQARIFGFQSAIPESGLASTTTVTMVQQGGLAACRSPEVALDPSAATRASDVFSFGAVAYWILTGKAPALTSRDARDRLSADGAFLPSVDRPDLKALDVVFECATNANRGSRFDSVREWVLIFLEELTGDGGSEAPDETAPQPEKDPTKARAGDRVGRFEVLHLLGSGATARVLAVKDEDDEHRYALKVPLSSDQEDTLREEGRALERLGATAHPGLVRLIDRPVVGGRLCLLLSLCSQDTLADRLGREGTIALDLAARWGADLFDAVSTLERAGIPHRDIKPTNLGFPAESRKQADHLILYDFSLTGLDEHQIAAGTRAWRDPFLQRRGTWDAAADRYAVAAVLYEMLTGRSPRLADPDVAVTDEAASLAIESHLFDPKPREALSSFFSKAFHPDAKARFPDAAEMSSSWLKACEGASSRHEDGELPEDLSFDTLLQSLPLTAPVLNVLDRAGLQTVRDLLELPRNAISAVRGCGRTTRDQVLQLRERIDARLASTATLVPKKAFLPGFDLPPRKLDAVPGVLGSEGLVRLTDGGITSTAALASSEKTRVRRLLNRSDTKAPDLERWLKALQTEAKENATPGTLTAWARALFGPDQGRGGKLARGLAQARATIGYPSLVPTLDGPSGLQFASNRVLAAAPRVGEVARAFEVKPPVISIARRKQAEQWAAHPALGQLIEVAKTSLDTLGGLASLELHASQLASAIPPAEDDEAPALRAAALLRALALVGRLGLREDIPFTVQAHGQRDWCSVDAASLALVPAIGRSTTDLLQRTDPPIVSASRLRQALARIVTDTPVATLSEARLAPLAAATTEAIRVNSRLELFDPSLKLEVALDTIGAALPDPLHAADLRERLAARFPGLAALGGAPPWLERPALDELLAPLGFTPEPGTDAFTRVVEDDATSYLTQGAGTRRPLTQAAPSGSSQSSPATRFERSLRLAGEEGRFRVLTVPVRLAAIATDRLVRHLNARPLSLSRVLAHAMDEALLAKGGKPEKLRELDATGPAGPRWPTVSRIARDAALEVHGIVLGDATLPVVLSEPGLYARFGLTDALAKLLTALNERDGAAAFLVLPVHQEMSPLLAPGVDCPLPGTQELLLPVPERWIEAAPTSPTP